MRVARQLPIKPTLTRTAELQKKLTLAQEEVLAEQLRRKDLEDRLKLLEETVQKTERLVNLRENQLNQLQEELDKLRDINAKQKAVAEKANSFDMQALATKAKNTLWKFAEQAGIPPTILLGAIGALPLLLLLLLVLIKKRLGKESDSANKNIEIMGDNPSDYPDAFQRQQ